MKAQNTTDASAARINSRRAFWRSITTHLEGGLGNQLFQYAMARAMALRHGCPLNLDTSFFIDYKLRPFALGVYHIQANVLSDELGCYIEQLDSQKNMAVRAMRKVGRIVLPWFVPTMVYEDGMMYQPALMDIKPSAYLRGYWQTEKYFKAIRPQLLEELSLKGPLTGANLETARQIQAGPSLSLHVRRTDYVTTNMGQELLGTCSLAYYKQALELVTSRCPNLNVFVFSDDQAWARQNIQPNLKTVYVDHNDGSQGHEDIRLMSLCNHNIIANSTFSWWGAWLNRHEDKIVCCPANWYVSDKHDNPDIYAQGWHQV